MAVAVVAGRVLIPVPLYLWQRPRAPEASWRSVGGGQPALSPLASAVADAILDRLVNNAYELELGGHTRRKDKTTHTHTD